jgi:hypothetical protein
MELTLLRLKEDNLKQSTVGVLYINGVGECFTLEDEKREVKVKGETRIPEGRYRITFRKEGGFHQRYSSQFSSIHKGMLWVRDVPGFEYILIHLGNTDKDTDGCILVGDTVKKGFLGESKVAYQRIYPIVASALEKNEEVWITIIDIQDTGIIKQDSQLC